MASLSPLAHMKFDSESVAVIGGGAIALLAAAGVVLAPGSAIDDSIVASGVFGGGPFGRLAHGLVALGAALAAGGVSWSLLYLVFGRGGLIDARRRRAAGEPVVRRADAHPDCPPKHPMSAADLGTPLMEVPPPVIEQDLPRDLEQPLAAYHPAAIRAAPLEPVRPVPSLAVLPIRAVPRPVERIETFPLPPIAPAVPPPAPRPGLGRFSTLAPDNDARPTIEALLRRLEDGAVRRTQRA
jgi:hypothetical protein